MDNPIKEPSGASPPGAQSPPSSFRVTESLRYEEWYATRAGVYAKGRKEALLRRLLSGWPRRSRNMLVMDAGTGFFLESLWHSGFDVAGQERDPKMCAAARERLGARAELSFAQPDDLPFDDGSFDYAVAVDSFEFWADPEAALIEMRRVACVGAILIFPNAPSFFGLRCFCTPGKDGFGSLRPFLYSRRSVQKIIASAFGDCKTTWRSTPLTPPCAWRAGQAFDLVNTVDIRFILGGFAGVRIDFEPFAAGTPLPVSTRETAPYRS